MRLLGGQPRLPPRTTRWRRPRYADLRRFAAVSGALLAGTSFASLTYAATPRVAPPFPGRPGAAGAAQPEHAFLARRDGHLGGCQAPAAEASTCASGAARVAWAAPSRRPGP